MIAAYQLLPRRQKKLAHIALLGAPFAPFFWDSITTILLFLTQNPVSKLLLARNDPSAVLDGSNRVTTWLASIQFLSVWTPQHLVGHGGVPVWLLPEGLGWVHTHNGPLQLVFDAGLISLAVVVFVIIVSLTRYSRAARGGREAGPYRVGLGALLSWILLSGIEPTIRNYTIVHITFLTLAGAVAVLRSPRAGPSSLTSRHAPTDGTP
jgi:O-antigen ligase